MKVAIPAKRDRLMARGALFAVLVGGFALGAVAYAQAKPAREPLTRKRLSVPTEIQGYPCAADYAWFFGDGKLQQCAVWRDILFGEISIPAQSWINLNHDGSPWFVFLARDTPIHGYICKGGGPLGPREGAMTALYPGGQLNTCWLAADSVVDGIPCVHASMWADAFGGGSGTYFHENGGLKSCKLSRDAVVGDRAFRRGDRIQLDRAGRPVSASPQQVVSEVH